LPITAGTRPTLNRTGYAQNKVGQKKKILIAREAQRDWEITASDRQSKWYERGQGGLHKKLMPLVTNRDEGRGPTRVGVRLEKKGRFQEKIAKKGNLRGIYGKSLISRPPEGSIALVQQGGGPFHFDRNPQKKIVAKDLPEMPRFREHSAA